MINIADRQLICRTGVLCQRYVSAISVRAETNARPAHVFDISTLRNVNRHMIVIYRVNSMQSGCTGGSIKIDDRWDVG